MYILLSDTASQCTNDQCCVAIGQTDIAKRLNFAASLLHYRWCEVTWDTSVFAARSLTDLHL